MGESHSFRHLVTAFWKRFAFPIESCITMAEGGEIESRSLARAAAYKAVSSYQLGTLRRTFESPPRLDTRHPARSSASSLRVIAGRNGERGVLRLLLSAFSVALLPAFTTVSAAP